MIKVHVIVGVGGWKTRKDVELLACPHVGDAIAFGDHSVQCERVTIFPDYVQVEELVRFNSEQEAKDYFKE